MRRIINIKMTFEGRGRDIPTTQDVINEITDSIAYLSDAKAKVAVVSTTEANYKSRPTTEVEEG